MHPQTSPFISPSRALQAVLTTAALGNPAAAAERIVELVLPQCDSQGAEHYRARAQDWLTLLLRAHPGLSLQELARQLYALGAVSPGIRAEVGGLAGRIAIAMRS